jgi:hypothetical protein
MRSQAGASWHSSPRQAPSPPDSTGATRQTPDLRRVRAAPRGITPLDSYGDVYVRRSRRPRGRSSGRTNRHRARCPRCAS